MPDIILSESKQKTLQHTLKKIASAYRLLTLELDELHDEIFVNNKEATHDSSDSTNSK